MYAQILALILREVQYKESSKILTVLTREEGKMTVSARGALREKSALAAPTQALVYARMTLWLAGGRAYVREAEVLESFRGLREELGRFALGAYAAEVLEAVSPEGVECAPLLELGLGTLYTLSAGKRPGELVKAACEWRMAAENGLAPLLEGCAVCGGDGRGGAVLSLHGGALYCEDCREERPPGPGAVLTSAALEAVRYVTACPVRRLFSFDLPGAADRVSFADAAERYLLCQLDRGFRTLDFYKGLP